MTDQAQEQLTCCSKQKHQSLAIDKMSKISIRIVFLTLLNTLLVLAGEELSLGDIVSFTPKGKKTREKKTQVEPTIAQLNVNSIQYAADYNLRNFQSTFLATTFSGGSGSFGNMWDVKATGNIIVTGIDFHTDKPKGSLMNYEVWTKEGSFRDSMNDITVWSLIGKGVALSNGHGSGTPINRESFTSVIIGAGDVQGFYFTLDEYDLRYTDGVEVGATYKSNDDLVITEGVGVGTYPLHKGASFFGPRVWNGAIHYINTDAPASKFPTDDEQSKNIVNSPPPTLTPTISSTTATEASVTFKFNVNYPSSMERNGLIDYARKSVEKRLEEILSKRDNVVLGLRGGYSRLSVTRILVMHQIAIDTLNKCNRDTSCAMLEVIVTVSHSGMISELDVKNFLLGYSQDLAADIENQQMGAQYVGEVPSVVTTVISLSGKSFKHKMLSNESLSFEQSVKKFLENQFKSSSLKINDVKVENQHLVQKRRLRDRQHPFENEAKDEFQIETTISGEYVPPPEINFSEEIDESFSEHGDLFVQGVSKLDFFEEVTGVESISHSVTADIETTTTGGATATSPPSKATLQVFDSEDTDEKNDNPFFHKTFAISVYVLIGLLFFTVVVFFTRRRQTEQKNHIPRIEELMENRTFSSGRLEHGDILQSHRVITNNRPQMENQDSLINVNSNSLVDTKGKSFATKPRPRPPKRYRSRRNRGKVEAEDIQSTASSTRCSDDEPYPEGPQMTDLQMRSYFEDNACFGGNSFRKLIPPDESSTASRSAYSGSVVGCVDPKIIRTNSMNSSSVRSNNSRQATRREPISSHQILRTDSSSSVSVSQDKTSESPESSSVSPERCRMMVLHESEI